MSAETAVRRATASGRPRPLLAGPEPLERARALLAEREATYSKAVLHLDAERVAPAALARQIADRMEAER